MENFERYRTQQRYLAQKRDEEGFFQFPQVVNTMRGDNIQ